MALADIHKLHHIAQKNSRLIIGLMSGTSLDGLDIALCRISGSGKSTNAEVLEFETHSYPDALKEEIRQVFTKRYADLEKVCILNAMLADIHAGLILQSLKKWKVDSSGIDCIASHGQTIYHAPRRLTKSTHYPNSTLQIGDGDHIAVKTGIITLSDFRQKHVAAGGEGAPLALYGDYLLFSSPAENRILLNIGGISNFTFLPSGDDQARIISSDTGPGNTLIDAFMRKSFGLAMDKDAELASSGTVNASLLNAMLENPFFSEALPKSTGPELFSLNFAEEAQQRSGTQTISPNDLLATLVQLTAVSVTNAIQSLKVEDLYVYISGGGKHNPLLISSIQKLLPQSLIRNFEELGINPDAKEAVLFAVLANETLTGTATGFANAPVVTMGKISLPV